MNWTIVGVVALVGALVIVLIALAELAVDWIESRLGEGWAVLFRALLVVAVLALVAGMVFA